MDYVKHLWRFGYAIVRSVYSSEDITAISEEMNRLKRDGARYHGTHRHQNVVHAIRPHPAFGSHLRFILWVGYISPILDRYRTDRRQLELLEPILGNSLKQITNQVSWKTPKSEDTAFGFHQDARFRRPESAYRELATSYTQTFMAVDPHRVENGCLKIYPGSHQLGLLDLQHDRSVMDMEYENEMLSRCRLDPGKVVDIVLDPGDVALWLPHTLHSSGPNLSPMDRRAYVNGYVMADRCDRGEWAFREGQPCELGEPRLIEYEDLFTRPEPHYVKGAIYPHQKK